MSHETKPIYARPVSPHLTIYRWQISMVLSILHRITGVGLFFGSAVIVLWLWASAYAPAFYTTFYSALNSILGQVLLFCWVAAFYFHLGNGIRHLFWDIGKGFSLPVMWRSGVAVVVFAFVMTIFTWFIALTTTGAMS